MSAQDIKAWDDRNYKERMDTINNSYKMIIAKACKEDKRFWDKDMSIQEIDKSMPYNPKTAEPYLNVTGVVLKTVMELNGYKEPQFMTMRQANTLGGKLKKQRDENGEVVISEKTGKEQYVQGVLIPFMKEYDLVPKLDKEGKPITETKEINGQTIEQPVMIKKYLTTPVLETKTLYHVSQFEDIKQEKLKEMNTERLNALRERFSNTKDEPSLRQLNSIGLMNQTKAEIENYIQATSKGHDFKSLIAERDRQNEKMKKEYVEQQKKAQEKQKPKAKSAGMERG